VTRPTPPPTSTIDPSTPVLIGIGLGGSGAEPADLMAAATEAALVDACGHRMADEVVCISVPQGSWSYPDPARLVAERVGAKAARTELSELGIPQQRLVNQALSAIRAGAGGLFVVTGGEARRWERDRTSAAGEADGPAQARQPGAVPDVTHRRPGPLLEPIEVRHRLWEPIQQYAMIENVLVAAEGRTVAEGRAEVAGLWAKFNKVARSNPLAAFPEALDAAAIDTPSPGNRPLAFPYNKWHASQWTVDQAAALVLCSVETARRLRVPPERWVFPVVGLDSSHAVSLLARRQPETWPAMEVLGRATAARIGRPVGECEVIEVYSCFPSAVRVQQRALGLDPEGVPTVTGGMAFAGGPFNNFVLQATVAVAERLRGDPSALGLVTTVSGLLTKPGIGVWSAGPDGQPPLVGDLAGEAAAATEVVEVADDDAATEDPVGGTEGARAGAGNTGATSPATVVTATVTYDGLEPARTLALCDRPDGRRTVAMSEDRSLAARVVAHGLAGESVEVRAGELLFG
jgi:acetyl-CoA C-acetyltransferase